MQREFENDCSGGKENKPKEVEKHAKQIGMN